MQQVQVKKSAFVETQLPVYGKDGHNPATQVFDTTIDLLIPMLFQTINHWLETGVCSQDETGLIDFVNDGVL